MQILTAYSLERLDLLQRLLLGARGTPLSELFRPAAEDLRFRLGTSLADLRIPFRVSDSLRKLWKDAASEAWLLVCARHKTSPPPLEPSPDGELEQRPPPLRAVSFQAPASVTREPVRRLFSDAVTAHPGLDAGLVASFLGTGRPGRTLAAALHAVFVKARDEATRGQTGEPTPYLVALMLRSLAEHGFQLARESTVSRPSTGFLRSAVGVLMAQAAFLALREGGLGAEAAGGPDLRSARALREGRTRLLARAALGLLPFVGSRPHVLVHAGLSAHGITLETAPPRLDELQLRLSRGDAPDTLAAELAQQAVRERPLGIQLERAAAFASLRENLSALERLRESGRAPAVPVPPEPTVGSLLLAKDGLEKLFGAEARRKELARAARELARHAPVPDARQRLEALAHAAREWRDDEPAAWLGAAESRLNACRSVVALAADAVLDRCAAQACSALLERTGRETEAGATAEYDTGRLYLVSHEPRPLLQARLEAPRTGHLFCDMKDFTRRTAFLKESVIADFIQREFYRPILAAAWDPDEELRGAVRAAPVTLNNLLGDAVSFSGDIVALVRMAYRIRAALSDYSRRLANEASQETVAARVREVEARHRLRRAAMERMLRELVVQAAAEEPGLRAVMLQRAEDARAEIVREEAAFKAQLAQAAGEQLEAGLFLSFGAPPEVATFEDPLFGPLKVAIAEKINESARGTARVGGVRAKVKARLDRARIESGLDLELPFQVLVDTPPAVPLAPDQAVAAAALQREGATEAAERLLLQAVRTALARETDASTGELWNTGAAMSDEALEAYLEARAGEILVARRDTPAADLHLELRKRFFFPRPALEVVAVLHPVSRALQELFVFQGRVQFRGFEAGGGLGVYEMVAPESALFRLLETHHVPGWASETQTVTPTPPGPAAPARTPAPARPNGAPTPPGGSPPAPGAPAPAPAPARAEKTDLAPWSTKPGEGPWD